MAIEIPRVRSDAAKTRDNSGRFIRTTDRRAAVRHVCLSFSTCFIADAHRIPKSAQALDSYPIDQLRATILIQVTRFA